MHLNWCLLLVGKTNVSMKEYENLENQLKSSGVKMNLIKINQTPEDSTFCILNYGEEIETFYFERGVKSELHSFTKNSEAIEHFKKWVTSIEYLCK